MVCRLSNLYDIATLPMFRTFRTVDGRNPAPVEVGSLSHDLQGFIHPRWLFGISSINSRKPMRFEHLPFLFFSFCLLGWMSCLKR